MAAPTITVQPISQVILLGGTVSFSVTSPGSSSYQWYKGGVAIVGGSNNVLTIPSTTLTDSSSYTVQCLNIDGSVTSNPATLTVVETILDGIEKEIELLILGMSIASGYKFDWATVNEEDEAIGSFPRAIIDPRDSLADKISNMDTVSGISSRAYTNEVLFTVLASGELPSFNTNPSFAIRSIMRNALNDLLKLFGNNNQVGGYCDNILFSGSQIEAIRTGDIVSPANLRTIWKVIYSVDRIDPTKYAGS
jgi:hypothetical protein